MMNTPEIFKIESPKGNFFIREFKPEDENSVLRGWRLVFKKEIAPSYWKWKYYQNPGGFRTIICITEDGEIAVHYAGQGARTWFFDQEILGLQLVDIYSHPKYRWAIGGKTGLFVKTAHIFWQTFMENAPFESKLELNSTKSKAKFVWGLPGKRHARLGQLIIKYGKLPNAFYAEYLPSHKEKRHLLWSLNKKNPKKDTLPQGLNRLWHKFKAKFSPFCIIKDECYIHWRYWLNPNDKKYNFYILKRPWSSEIKAWLVTIQENHSLIILDFLAEDASHLKKLISMITNEEKCKLKIWLSEASNWKNIFQSLFIPKEEPLGIVPSIQGFYTNLMKKKDKFHWIMGDCDLF